MSAIGAGEDSRQDWDRWWDRFVYWVPWVLLPLSTVLVLAQTGQGPGHRAVALGLTALASAWVLFGHTFAPPARLERLWPAVVYVLGLVALGAVMMAHDIIFLLFAITPFFHAMVLPMPWAFAGVAAASFSLHTSTMGFPGTSTDTPFLQHLGLYAGVIVVQTLAIGGGLVVAQRSAEAHRERAVMVDRLEAALEENAGLHAQLLAQAREAGMLDERQRMAREIHDTLAQGLTGIVTQIQAAQRAGGIDGPALPHVGRALDLARGGLTEARRSVQALRPAQLEDSQLPEALGELTRRWAEESGVRPTLEVTGGRTALSPAIEVSLFRVAQEALTNVAKHANATRVGVTLSYLDDMVLLDIRDDGNGMVSDTANGFGLRSMRQRIRGIGGTVEIESDHGEGTAVSAAVPVIGGAS
ncbi:sensor histidine kinase [Nocardiopsis aegyptia]|uniref:Oxygen sensor histidine kinase NreB n=1 Tax=Nocardiopsis aegyptia TaxID=220378 RepID=A0A7Z0JD38_9ACTN|nr:sensor histidine kinase [Nocardiopsis aegyptia]NYJ37050.1 signal transduction histidine kinase [Nocardiopsis aegyptia]